MLSFIDSAKISQSAQIKNHRFKYRWLTFLFTRAISGETIVPD